MTEQAKQLPIGVKLVALNQFCPGLVPQALTAFLPPLDSPGETTNNADVANEGAVRTVFGAGPFLADEAATAIIHVEACHETDAGDSWVRLVHERRPGSPPPQFVTAFNQQTGGSEALIQALDGLGGGGSQAVSVRLIFDVHPKFWRFEGLRAELTSTSVFSRARKLAAGAVHLERVGFRFERAPRGLVECTVTFLHDSGSYRAEVAAVWAEPALSVDWPREAIEMAAALTETLFEMETGHGQ